MPRKPIVPLAVLAFAFLAPHVVLSQVLYGSAVGTLQDPTGAVIEGGHVTLTSKGTGVTRETITGSDGRYTVSSLLPGTYELKIVATGFRSFTRTDVDIRVNSVTRIDVSLELGQVAEQVTVQGVAAALQTDKSDVSAEIPARAVENLPLAAYRNFQALINLVP